jgi:REP element-mobilizing transposase RayT
MFVMFKHLHLLHKKIPKNKKSKLKNFILSTKPKKFNQNKEKKKEFWDFYVGSFDKKIEWLK